MGRGYIRGRDGFEYVGYDSIDDAAADVAEDYRNPPEDQFISGGGQTAYVGNQNLDSVPAAVRSSRSVPAVKSYASTKARVPTVAELDAEEARGTFRNPNVRRNAMAADAADQTSGPKLAGAYSEVDENRKAAALAQSLDATSGAILERVAKGDFVFQYSPKQRQRVAKINEEIDIVRGSENLRNSEKLSSIERLQRELSEIAPRPELAQESPYEKGKEPGKRWQEGLSMFTTNTDGTQALVKEASITPKAFSDISEAILKTVTTTTAVRDAKGMETSDEIDTVAWPQYFRQMRSQLAITSAIIGLSYEDAQNPESGRMTIDQMILMGIPEEDATPIARKYGLLPPEAPAAPMAPSSAPGDSREFDAVTGASRSAQEPSGMILMRGPDGSSRRVPRNRVDELKRMGATIIS